MDRFNIEEQQKKFKIIADSIETVIIGKREVVKMLLVSLLAGGHVLVEDVPGVGKTTLAMALGRVTGLVCRRAQFTPDVMASDITGFNMFNKETGKFEYRSGLVMTNILLADEINRTTPKTQSALLEAMEEQTVTVDGVTYKLPSPFMVIATQNELGYVGTFLLPEAQLDRFIMRISIGYPTLEQEVSIISDRQHENPLKSLKTVCTKEELEACIEVVREVNLESSLYRYIVQLVAATREHPSVQLGASPRASLALMRAVQGYAFLSGRMYAVPEDVIKVLPYVLPHRIQLTQEAKMKKITALDVIGEIVKGCRPPFTKNG